MQPHIARTIEDIELKIGFLRRLAEALRSFDTVAAVGAAVPEAPRAQARAIQAGPIPNGRTGTRRLITQACRPGRRGGETLRLVAVVEKLDEPITILAIAAAANVDNKKASNFITCSVKKGWLSRVNKGQYRRLAGFGGGMITKEGGGRRAVVRADSSRN